MMSANSSLTSLAAEDAPLELTVRVRRADKNTPVVLRLTNLTIEAADGTKSKRRQIPLRDLIGVAVEQHVVRFHLLLQRSPLVDDGLGYLKTYTFVFDTLDAPAEQFITEAKSRAGLSNEGSRWLVISNPVAGSKRATRTFRQSAVPVLAAAGHSVVIHDLQHHGHATELARSVNFSTYDGIIACGGDGLVNEIINGLLTRADGAYSRRPIPIVPYPLGSQNALAAAMGIRDVRRAIMVTIKGEVGPLDVGSATELRGEVARAALDGRAPPDERASLPHENGGLGGDRTRYFCCALYYGFMSDVLRDTLPRRWMGALRYAYCGFIRIVRGVRPYGATVSFVPSRAQRTRCGRCTGDDCVTCRVAVGTAMEGTLSSTVEGGEPAVTKRTGGFTTVLFGCHAGKGTNIPEQGGMFPYGHISDGLFDVVMLRPVTRFELLRFTFRVTSDGRSHLSLRDRRGGELVEYHKTNAAVLRREDRLVGFGLDGEYVDPPGSDCFYIRMHPGLVRVMLVSGAMRLRVPGDIGGYKGFCRRVSDVVSLDFVRKVARKTRKIFTSKTAREEADRRPLLGV